MHRESELDHQRLMLYEKEKILNEREIVVHKQLKDLQLREDRIMEIEYKTVKRER